MTDNPDAKYGRENLVIHDRESMKDFIMAKLKYSTELNFMSAVRVCIPFAKETLGISIDANQKEFYAKFFDEIAILERLKFITVVWMKDDQRPGKRKLKMMTLAEKGEEWFMSNDFKL